MNQHIPWYTVCMNQKIEIKHLAASTRTAR